MRIEFLAAAEEELHRAARFYERQVALVIAIMHQRRKPGYWQERLTGDE